MNKNLILAIGVGLVILGLTKPDLSGFSFINRPNAIDVLELPSPNDDSIKEKASVVAEILTNNPDHKSDAKKLRDLYLDIAKLIALDGENEVVKNTEEIRQANSIAGLMLRLDIKGKYKGLSDASHNVIVSAIGDDNIPLNKELRAKAVDAFNALGWACNTGAK